MIIISYDQPHLHYQLKDTLGPSPDLEYTTSVITPNCTDSCIYLVLVVLTCERNYHGLLNYDGSSDVGWETHLKDIFLKFDKGNWTLTHLITHTNFVSHRHLYAFFQVLPATAIYYSTFRGTVEPPWSVVLGKLGYEVEKCRLDHASSIRHIYRRQSKSFSTSYMGAESPSLIHISNPVQILKGDQSWVFLKDWCWRWTQYFDSPAVWRVKPSSVDLDVVRDCDKIIDWQRWDFARY